MTLAEVVALVGSRKVARHRGQVFFTVYDDAEADEWESRGARVTRGSSHGQLVAEVHLYALLDEPTEVDADGTPVDNRALILADYYAERDGYTKPLHLVPVPVRGGAS